MEYLDELGYLEGMEDFSAFQVHLHRMNFHGEEISPQSVGLHHNAQCTTQNMFEGEEGKPVPIHFPFLVCFFVFCFGGGVGLILKAIFYFSLSSWISLVRLEQIGSKFVIIQSIKQGEELSNVAKKLLLFWLAVLYTAYFLLSIISILKSCLQRKFNQQRWGW